ncbi:uncharacterized protein WCC33_011652 [Rhinophrynus dorsalis]
MIDESYNKNYTDTHQLVMDMLASFEQDPLIVPLKSTSDNTEYADCIGHGVVTLADAIQHLPSSTKWLNTSQNEISKIEYGAFSHLPNLLELQLSRNRINSIQSGAFQNLSNLYFLDLSYNLIQYLDTWNMENLTSLITLHLSHNKLHTMQGASLNMLKFLQELDLSFNYISDFRPVVEAVNKLYNFSILNLCSNNISKLNNQQGVIVIPSLQYLNLCNNSIFHFDFTNYFMPNLIDLNLTRNNMSDVNRSSFNNVPNLSKITFDENPLNISRLLGSYLPNLTSLHLSSMRPALQHSVLPACKLFQTLPKLKLLDIKHSKVLTADLLTIANCTNLTSLILSTTSLCILKSKEFQTFRNLEVLYLNKCKLRKIHNSTWRGLKRLHSLILERNFMSSLEDFLFSPLVNLQFLDLSKNHLTYINPKAFNELHVLKYLKLKDCKIAVLSLASFMFLKSLKTLDLRENSISFIKGKSFVKLNKLETLLLSKNKIATIQKYGFSGLTSLKHLSLSKNILYKLTNNTFKWLKSLVSLDLSNNRLWSFNKYQSPNPFLLLQNLETLDLSYQKPRDVRIPRTLFKGLQSLKQLKFRGNPCLFLTNISFNFLLNMTEFDISEMIYSGTENPVHFNKDLFSSLSKLRHLVLDKNGIQDLPEDMFENVPFLESLSLRYNRLKNITRTILQNLTHLTYIDLYMNPLSCSCENYWFQNWSEFNTMVQIPLVQSYNCFGHVASDLNFINQDFSFCGTDIAVYFFVGSFVTTLLLLLVNLFMVKLKWTIHYGFYLLQAWFLWKIKKEQKVYMYDAYISYCSDDELWVMEKLLFKLEIESHHKYKLCFKPRDFIPGACYIDNIQDAIKSSRKTLCVVSRKYMESDWCRMEMQLACSRVFYQKEDVLLMVLLEEIPDYRLSAYHKLRKLIKQNTYISWPEDPQGEDLFWFKLRKALDVGVNEEEDLQLSMTNENV